MREAKDLQDVTMRSVLNTQNVEQVGNKVVAGTELESIVSQKNPGKFALGLAGYIKDHFAGALRSNNIDVYDTHMQAINKAIENVYGQQLTGKHRVDVRTALSEVLRKSTEFTVSGSATLGLSADGSGLSFGEKLSHSVSSIKNKESSHALSTSGTLSSSVDTLSQGLLKAENEIFEQTKNKKTLQKEWKREKKC